MVFTEPGTYSYTIAETRGGTPGYFYDEAVYTVEVRVEKLENGTLSVSKHLRRNGVTVNNIRDGLNFLDSMLTSLGCGLGFFLAMVLFSGVRSRVAVAKPPKSFEGLPITLVSAAIVSLSFFGFAGIITNLFG